MFPEMHPYYDVANLLNLRPILPERVNKRPSSMAPPTSAIALTKGHDRENRLNPNCSRTVAVR
jgi:hypothetical protein